MKVGIRLVDSKIGSSMIGRRSHPHRTVCAWITCLVVSGWILATFGDAARARQIKDRDTLKFAAQMARSGNWREAGYRWELVRKRDPGNFRVLNNLAVAAEAMGELEQARQYYVEALALSGDDPRIDENHRRFLRFWRKRQPGEEGGDEDGPAARAPGAPDGAKRGNGKTDRVSIAFPVPPRLEVASGSSILVASFLTEDSAFLDVNRELVRFLRNEFRKRTSLEVVQVIPPPAIPEQTLEDLVANTEFWQHLSREYEADLIVSGVMEYDREDVSGFRDVDVTSVTTGHKVRQARFVEQEQFNYHLELLFIDGPSGALLFRDRLQRSLLFQGQQNDPITAFHEMSESIAADVLAVVTPRTRTDTRVIFRS